MRIIKTIFVIMIFIFLVLIYENIQAFKDGIVGLTKKNGQSVGCVCHQFKPNDTVSVVIAGPSAVNARDSAIYTLKIANGPHVAGGCDIAVSLGNIYTVSLDTSLRRAEPVPGAGFELTHRYPKLFKGDTLTFTFLYVAPDTPNVIDTLFANGNSVNHDTTPDNDIWNYARNFTINITPTSAIINNTSLVKSFELKQNYPNPFNPETRIEFTLNKSMNVSLLIYDANGKEIAKLINNKFYSSGNYSLTFNSHQYNLTSEVYFYKLYSDNFSDLKKMILIK